MGEAFAVHLDSPRVWVLIPFTTSEGRPRLFESMHLAMLTAYGEHKSESVSMASPQLRWEYNADLDEWWGITGAGKSVAVAYRVYAAELQTDDNARMIG